MAKVNFTAYALILCAAFSAYAQDDVPMLVKKEPLPASPAPWADKSAIIKKPVAVLKRRPQTDYGMSKVQVLASTWGAPKRRQRDGGYEWWDYGCGYWLLFYGGELVEFYTPEDEQ